MDTLPFVSIIIPCLNEENHIGKCLDSVIANDYPKDRLEAIVIDGISEDATREILERYSQRYSFIKVLDNEKKITPVALNVGIKNAKGGIIVRMDAHSTYERDYITKCVKYLEEYKADNVGGIWITVPRNNSLIAKAITIASSHSFGVGNAHYKTGNLKEPKWVDTVPYGCFRKEIFDRIGLFDEKLHRNEDIEFNDRLQKAGGKILLVPEIKINYYVRSTFKSFIMHNFDNGLKVTYSVKLGRNIFSWRHLIPMIFVMALIGTAGLWGLSILIVPSGFSSQLMLRDSLSLLGLSKVMTFLLFLLIIGSYSLSNLLFSIHIAFKEKRLIYLFILPLIFASLHFSYGTGSIWGLIKGTISGSRE